MDRGQTGRQDLSQDLARHAPKKHGLKEGLPLDEQGKICVPYGQLRKSVPVFFPHLPIKSFLCYTL